MTSLIVALVLTTQCPGGVCPAPPAVQRSLTLPPVSVDVQAAPITVRVREPEVRVEWDRGPVPSVQSYGGGCYSSSYSGGGYSIVEPAYVPARGVPATAYMIEAPYGYGGGFAGLESDRPGLFRRRSARITDASHVYGGTMNSDHKNKIKVKNRGGLFGRN